MQQLHHTLQYILNEQFKRAALPSKSTSPSPFKSTSLRISSTSFRPTWKKKKLAEVKWSSTFIQEWFKDSLILQSKSYLLTQQLPHCVPELRCAYGTVSISVKLRTKSRGTTLKMETLLVKISMIRATETRYSYLSKRVFQLFYSDHVCGFGEEFWTH